MSLQEVLSEIYRMPLSKQKELVKTLSLRINEKEKVESNNDVYQKLFDKGLITHIPKGLKDDDFTPISFEDETLSETIIRERR